MSRRQGRDSARLVVACLLLAGVAAPAVAQNNAADTERLIKALGIAPGQTILEIGAGAGDLTVAMAKAVGPDGRVYSNEISAPRRDDIARAVKAAGLANVTIVEGQAATTNVPEGCCDAAFMRNVYHHIEEVAAMNRSLYASLKPGARIAIIDFPPRSGGESAAPSSRAAGNRHGVTHETVAAELTAAGFEVLETDRPESRWFMVVARKPD